MKNYPFLLMLIGWIMGTLISNYIVIDAIWLIRILCLILVGLILSFRIQLLFTILLTLFMIVSGFSIHQKNNSYQPLPEVLTQENHWILLEIQDDYRSSTKYRKNKARIHQIDQFKVLENYTLLYWPKYENPLNYGDLVWVKSKILPNQDPKNPHQFDYKKYLSRQQIHYTLFGNEHIKRVSNGNSWRNKIAVFKKQMRINLLRSGYSTESVDIIGAMLLGDRTEMDKTIEENYRKTGVVHILSISGLHIVMVYSIIFVVLYPLQKLKYGQNFRIILSIIFIWLYALFVEFQPPVARSALMITIFHLSVLVNRNPNLYHTLSLSALILLVYNPNFLYDIGFQLSFIAVFFIVWLMPIYQKLLPSKHQFVRYCRDFLGTSISAQIGTFPIATYYFHQSSGLFLVGNVLMIPASFLMIVGGIITIILQMLNLKLNVWIWLFNEYIGLCNRIIYHLSNYRSLVFENLWLDEFDVIALLLLGFLLRFLVLEFRPKLILIYLSIMCLLSVHQIYLIKKFNSKQELIVFDQYKNSIIGIRYGTELDLWVMNLADTIQFHQYTIKPYLINEKINRYRYFDIHESLKSHYFKTKNLVQIKDQQILLINGFEPNQYKNIHFVIVQNSSQIDVDSIPTSTQIILDGSNFPNHLDQWHHRIHRTRTDGYVRISL